MPPTPTLNTAAPTPITPPTPDEAQAAARAHLGRCFAAAADYCHTNGYGAARLDKLTAVAQLKEKDNV